MCKNHWFYWVKYMPPNILSSRARSREYEKTLLKSPQQRQINDRHFDRKRLKISVVIDECLLQFRITKREPKKGAEMVAFQWVRSVFFCILFVFASKHLLLGAFCSPLGSLLVPFWFLGLSFGSLLAPFG